ncbi:MAG: cupin domain-containing protein [Rhodospirillaceae bacterium]
MPRPHIEFIHAQELAWQKSFLNGSLSSIECKVLSHDPQTGACSIIMRYPPGWQQTGPLHLTAAQELLVLDGSIQIGDQTYPFDSYAYLPKGYTYENWHTENGAVILTFFSSGPDVVFEKGNMVEEAIPFIYLHEMKWSSADVDPDLDFLRIAHKILRHDEISGEKTMVLDCGAQSHPQNWEEGALAHPCVEEMFLLSGDIITNRGAMHAGAYFWRPPNIWHGPFGSRNGNLCVIRFLHGHHVNNWSEKRFPFSLTPEHKPDLPDSLKDIAGKPFSAPTPY